MGTSFLLSLSMVLFYIAYGWVLFILYRNYLMGLVFYRKASTNPGVLLRSADRLGKEKF